MKSALTDSGIKLVRFEHLFRIKNKSNIMLEKVSNPNIGVLSSMVGTVRGFFSYKVYDLKQNF